MNFFLNDYNDIACDRVLEALRNEKINGHIGYGVDEISKEAAEFIKRDIKCKDVEIHFVHGGTMANILILSHRINTYEGIISVHSGHIEGHETGSIEATGHKIHTIYSEDGKLSGEKLKEALEEFGEEYMVVPRMVYISNTTELGTVYNLDEVREIYRVCKENGLYLYIDGARMAVALAASSINPEVLPEICDAFTLGGTKNGAMYGEALVIVNDELKKDFRFYLKQRGAMLAKGFALGIQFRELFRDGLYYENGRVAYEMGSILAKGLREIGVEFAYPPESNQVFILLSKDKVEKLRENNAFEITGRMGEKLVVRFVTNYRTTEDEVKNLMEDLKCLMN